MYHNRGKTRRPNRRGVALLLALGCLAVATALIVSLSRSATIGRQATRQQTWRMQAEWLAESAVERAAAQLAEDPDYEGETWLLSAAQLGGEHDALVDIKVASNPDQPRRRLVDVRADYPNHPVHRASNNKQITVRLPEEMEQ